MKRVLNLEVHTQMDALARRPSSLTALPLASISELSRAGKMPPGLSSGLCRGLHHGGCDPTDNGQTQKKEGEQLRHTHHKADIYQGLNTLSLLYLIASQFPGCGPFQNKGNNSFVMCTRRNI